MANIYAFPQAPKETKSRTPIRAGGTKTDTPVKDSNTVLLDLAHKAGSRTCSNRKPRAAKGTTAQGSTQPKTASSSLSLGDLLDFDTSGVIRLMGDSAANGDGSDPVVIQGKSELAIRHLMAEFCIPRMPLTIAEYYGLIEYVQLLFCAAGASVCPNDDEHRREWQSNSIRIYSEAYPEHEKAFPLYCAGEKKKLLSWHKKSNILERLAKGYSEFSNEEY